MLPAEVMRGMAQEAREREPRTVDAIPGELAARLREPRLAKWEIGRKPDADLTRTEALLDALGRHPGRLIRVELREYVESSEWSGEFKVHCADC